MHTSVCPGRVDNDCRPCLHLMQPGGARQQTSNFARGVKLCLVETRLSDLTGIQSLEPWLKSGGVILSLQCCFYNVTACMRWLRSLESSLECFDTCCFHDPVCG